MIHPRPFLATVLFLAVALPSPAQVELLDVGQARGRAAAAAPFPDWLSMVPVRSAFERVIAHYRYPDLTRAVYRAQVIPGLTGPCTPQGAAALSDGRVALSYHVEHPKATGPAGSVLAIMDASRGAVLAVRELQDTDGQPLLLHVGGIAEAGGWLWTGGSGRVLRFRVPSGAGRWLRADRSYDVDATVSFVSVSGGTLWVGDFYREGEKPAGRGWAAGYALDVLHSAPSTRITYQRDGRTVLRPDGVIHLPTQVQGFAVCDDRVVLSRSHGHSDGELQIWESPLASRPRSVTLPGNQSTSGWSLERRVGVIRVPAGPEDLEWSPPHLLVAFESGAQEYRDDWRHQGGLAEDRFMFIRLP